MSTLEQLKNQRVNVRRNITRISKSVEPSLQLSPLELTCRLSILEAYFKNAISIQGDIDQADPEELQRDVRCEIEELFIRTKLPRLSLPTFDGKYSEYQNFITSFRQVIGNQSYLSPIEKFNQLLNCLRGPALETVRAFQVTSENYTKALERLKNRYDNPTLVFLDNISSLFALPTAAKASGQQLRSLIDNASALCNSLRSLGNESQIAQAMLIFIVMGKVDLFSLGFSFFI